MNDQDFKGMKQTLDKKLFGSKEGIDKEELKKLLLAMTNTIVFHTIDGLKSKDAIKIDDHDKRELVDRVKKKVDSEIFPSYFENL